MRHPWTFAVLALALLSFVLQFMMVSVALPDLLEDLGAPLRWGGWALSAFLVTQIVAMSFAGRLVERYGAVAVFRAGVVGFGLVSLLCAVAPTFATFLAARALQGAAGGMIMPAGQAILGDLHDARDRSKVMGLFASIMPFGAVIGPFVGGVIVEAAGWRWTFVASLPLVLLVVLAARRVLPANRPAAAPAPLDGRGALLLLAFIPALVLALTELGLRDATPSVTLVGGGLGVAAAALVLLVWHERRVEHPMVDVDLFRRGEFLALNVLAFLFGLAWMGVFAIMPLYVQAAYGMGPVEVGTLMGPRSLAMVAVSTGAAILVRSTGFRVPFAVGLVGLSACLGLISLGLEDPRVLGVTFSTFWWLMVVITAAGLFFGFANPALVSAGMDLEPGKIASIAGLRGTALMLGGTIGISLVVMAGARSADVGAGMERMFSALALALLLALVVVGRVPARPGSPGDATALDGADAASPARAASAPAVVQPPEQLR
jgi:EmrB/QacA subfamily drug resistance transporter